MSPLLVIFAAAFGAATSAFLPRLAHRLAVGRADEPRSTCADCLRPFPPGVPGWVRVGAACSCARAGSARTILTGAAVAAALAAALGPAAVLPAYLLAAVPGLLLALIDLRCLRLPDPLVGALAVVAGLPLALLRPERIGTSLGAAVAVLTAYGIVAFMPRRGLGLGDVKLAAVLALILGFAGWPAVIVGLVLPHLLHGPVALFLLLTRRIPGNYAMPFGPALLAGALVSLTAT